MADPFPGHERFTGFLAIPYLGRDGRPLTMRFRCLQEHEHRSFGHGKYMSLKDEPSRTFNTRVIHAAREELHIAEGELDALMLTQHGYPAIAIPGAKAWRMHHARMVAGFSSVRVWGDPDEAGADFNREVTKSVRNAAAVRLVRADGDVSELVLKHGPGALAKRLAGDVG